MATPHLSSTAADRAYSTKGLTKKAYLNTLARFLDFGAKLLVRFFVTPLLVAGLGDFLYGVWLVLIRLTGYISVASGRPTQALKLTIANQQSSTDYEEKRRNVGSAICVWLLFSPLMALVGGVIVWFAPIWLSVPAELAMVVRVASGLLVAKLLMVTLVAIPSSVLEGENLGYKRMGLSAFVVILGGGLMALALYLNLGIAGVAGATLATVALNGLVYLMVARAYVPWFGIARPSGQATRKFLGLSGWFLAWRFIMRIMHAGDVVVLGILASAQLVSIYSLTRYLPEVVASIAAMMVFGATPGLGGIIGAGDMEKATRVRGEIMLLTWLLAVVGGATILLWNDAFLGLWVGSDYYAGILPTFLMLVMITQFTLIRNDATVIDLTLNLRTKVLLGLLSTAVSLGLAGALVAACDMGIVGVCIGFIAGRSILTIAYPIMVGRILDIPAHRQLRSLLRPALASALLIVMVMAPIKFWPRSWPASGYLAAGSWLELVVCVIATLVVIMLITVAVGMTRQQQSLIFRRFRALLNKVS